jgi:hypothetical protein
MGNGRVNRITSQQFCKDRLMRKQLWSAFVAGWAWSLLWSAAAPAQDGPASGRSYYNYGGTPAGTGAGVVPGGFQPPGYGVPGGQVPPAFEPYPSGPENAQAVPEMPPLNPFPATSPYDYALDQTFNEDGLWYRRMKNGRPKFYANIDFWGATLKAPQGTLLGEPVQSANTAWEQAQRLPDRILQNNLLDGYLTTVTVTFENLGRHEFNAPQNMQALNPDLRRLGMRFAFGEIDPDNTGYEVAGYFLVPREQGQTFFRGSIERSPDPSIANTVANLDGSNDTVSIPNTGRLTFDEGYNVSYKSQAWGTELNMFSITPINRDESVFLRAILGVRYYGISNSMTIYGQYSDLSGTVSIAQDPISTDNPPLPETTGFVTFVPRSSFSLTSSAISHLVGPQIGLQPEFGGKNFRVVTWAKFAPMVNFETVRLDAMNYGLPITDGDQSASDRQTNVHYSSVVNAGAMVQAPLFKYIPFLNTIPTLKDGTVRLGFDYVHADDIARSEKSVRYYAPLPKVEVRRTEQDLYGWFGGVGFTF